MPRLEARQETYFGTVRGMCRRCRSVGPSRVFFRDGQVWQESLCICRPQQPALIAADSEWYLAEAVCATRDQSPLAGASPPNLGCPHDCGPCTWHASPCQLPVLSITNACNLRCPICFTYNRADQIWHISVDEMRRIADWIVAASGRVDLINLTGGEPTLHPNLPQILEVCRRPEIGRITMNSNGIRLAEDFDLCKRLADLDVCVVLSLNTLDAEMSLRLHGCDLTAIKLKAIDNLAKAGVRMTLLTVLIRDANEHAIGDAIRLMRQYDNILSLTLQTMTYTGQGGGSFPPSRHIPADEAAQIFARESGGAVEAGDFVRRSSAHPLCYLVSYLLKSGEYLLPFTRFSRREEIGSLLEDSYLLRPGPAEDFFTDAINELYAAGETEHLAVLRKLVEQLYPPEGPISDFQRQRVAEQNVRTIYLHAHMDEDTFDCSRAMLCPDLVPVEAGRLIPACTYNLFYRMQDPRFFLAASEGDASP